jgi:hypothetical protein
VGESYCRTIFLCFPFALQHKSGSWLNGSKLVEPLFPIDS